MEASEIGGGPGRKGGGGEGKPSPHKGSNHASMGRRILDGFGAEGPFELQTDIFEIWLQERFIF